MWRMKPSDLNALETQKKKKKKLYLAGICRRWRENKGREVVPVSWTSKKSGSGGGLTRQQIDWMRSLGEEEKNIHMKAQ